MLFVDNVNIKLIEGDIYALSVERELYALLHGVISGPVVGAAAPGYEKQGYAALGVFLDNHCGLGVFKYQFVFHGLFYKNLPCEGYVVGIRYGKAEVKTPAALRVVVCDAVACYV